MIHLQALEAPIKLLMEVSFHLRRTVGDICYSSLPLAHNCRPKSSNGPVPWNRASASITLETHRTREDRDDSSCFPETAPSIADVRLNMSCVSKRMKRKVAGYGGYLVHTNPTQTMDQTIADGVSATYRRQFRFLKL